MSNQLQPKIEILPATATLDERVTICLEGFAPHQRVTLRANVNDAKGIEWSAHAVFEVDAQGTLDLSKQPPLSGSYTIADAMGLFWSMSTTKETDRGAMFDIKSAPLIYSFTVEVEGKAVASAHAERCCSTPQISRTVVHENGLAGVLFRPEGIGPFPVVIVVSGSGGGLMEWRAALYAVHGYAAFALAYFAYEDLPKDLFEIPLEYFEKAIQWLQAHPDIDGERIAVSGPSRGGELALLLGATFPQIKVTIAYVPSGCIWGGVGADPALNGAAWSYKGHPLSFIRDSEDPPIAAQREQQAKDGQPIDLTPGVLATLNALSPTDLEAVTIPVENGHCAILMISGKDDQMWPSSKMSEVVMDRLTTHGYRYPYKHLAYSEAGHMIVPPYTPAITYAIHPIAHILFNLGGTPQGYAHADADSWAEILRFLDENLAK